MLGRVLVKKGFVLKEGGWGDLCASHDSNCKGRRKKKTIRGLQRLTRSQKEGEKKNKRMYVRRDDQQSPKLRRRRNGKTTHSVCTRQLQDDANW